VLPHAALNAIDARVRCQNHAPGGGGTLVVAGSHRLVAALADEGAAATDDPLGARPGGAGQVAWLGFRDLFSPDRDPDRSRRLLDDGAVLDGVTVRLVELTGAADDVMVMHPWMLHAPSPNCSTTLRLMLMTTLSAALGKGVR